MRSLPGAVLMTLALAASVQAQPFTFTHLAGTTGGPAFGTFSPQKAGEKDLDGIGSR